MVSSRRFKNSGRKWARRSFMTICSASGRIFPFSSMPSRRYWEPMLEVRIRIVFLKSTVFPMESVIRPSSSTWKSIPCPVSSVRLQDMWATMRAAS